MNHNLPLPPPWPSDSQTARALDLYRISDQVISLDLVRAILDIKIAAARLNTRLGFLSPGQGQAIEAAARRLREAPESQLRPWFLLDALQGGAGTATHMNVNEAIVALAAIDSPAEPLHPLRQVNLHSSTNDVMPTALRIMLYQGLQALEQDLARAQGVCQETEAVWATTLIPGHTQLQEAVPLPLGRVAATWAAGLARDRWRTSKARERLKEVNLGGTAIGTGAGAPRAFVLGIVGEVREVTGLPLARAEDCVEATSNYDTLVEALGVLETLAVNLRRIAQDVRLMASGPGTAFGMLHLPALVKGSTIMPGKVNPVQAEALWQAAERILANHGLISRVAASSELQLNAFFPLLAATAAESLGLARRAASLVTDLVPALSPDKARLSSRLGHSYTGVLVLSPLFGYEGTERLVARAKEAHQGLKSYVEGLGILDPEDLAWLFAKANLQSFGYDEERYALLRQRYGPAIESWSKNP